MTAVPPKLNLMDKTKGGTIQGAKRRGTTLLSIIRSTLSL